MDRLVLYPSAIRTTTGPNQVSTALTAVAKLTCVENWFRALNELDVPTVYDPDEGIAAGGYFLAADIHPKNQTRSDARRTYYDPISGRKNYQILQNSHSTRILFDRPNHGGPAYRDLANDSQGDSGHRAGKRQQGPELPLRATGVEVSFSPIEAELSDHS